MSYSQTEMKIIQWLEARKIIQNQSPQTAVLKFISEAGELADAEIKGNHDESIDAVGDIMVTLINYCAIKHIDLVSCMEVAYDTIKDRTGTMLPNGVFVKDEPAMTVKEAQETMNAVHRAQLDMIGMKINKTLGEQL